jgi:hypothetical protein
MNAWQGETVVVLASGPTLTDDQCSVVRDWHAGGGGRVIAINTTFRRAPWADVLYACDRKWWNVYGAEVVASFRGQCWTQDAESAREFGLHSVRSVPAAGLSRRAGVVYQGGGPYWGGHSGYQAINLAYHWGAARFVILGMNLRKVGHATHWHEPHEGIAVSSPYERWQREFVPLVADLKAVGVEIVNATPDSALPLPFVPLEEALRARTLSAA